MDKSKWLPPCLKIYQSFDELKETRRSARDRPWELVALVTLFPYSRGLFEEWKKLARADIWPEDKTKRVAMWFYLQRSSFSGKFLSGWSHGKKRNPAATWSNVTALLIDVANRLRSVQIENKDFREVIQIYDSAETLFYCDPPYFQAKPDYCLHSFSLLLAIVYERVDKRGRKRYIVKWRYIAPEKAFYIMGGQRWKQEEIAILVENKHDIKKVANVLNRTEDACYEKLSRLGIRIKDVRNSTYVVFPKIDADLRREFVKKLMPKLIMPKLIRVLDKCLRATDLKPEHYDHLIRLIRASASMFRALEKWLDRICHQGFKFDGGI